MLRNDERWVIFMESCIKWVPVQAPNKFTIRELATVLIATAGTADAVCYPDGANKDEKVSLDSASLYPPSKPEFLLLLFSYSNVKGADPGFKNLRTNKNRVEKSKPDEAVAASAHMIISLNEKNRRKHSYYPAIIEDVDGLGKTKMQLAINEIIIKKKKFKFKDENDMVRDARAKFEMIGLDDEQVTKDAESGRLSYFVAIRDVKTKPYFDDSQNYKVTREETKMKPSDDGADGKTLKERLFALSQSALKKGYDKVQVHYVRKDGKNRSITFGTHREDSEDFLIKRIEKIQLKTIVGQTHDKPCDELVSAMAKLLRK